MSKYKLLLPKMGESVAEATITKWNKNVGDIVNIDDIILEIATDKVDTEVPSPVKGVLVSKHCEENDVVQVGDLVALIEVEGEVDEHGNVMPDAIHEVPFTPPVAAEVPQPAPTPQQSPVFEQHVPFVPVAEEKPLAEPRFYSPLVKNIAIQEGISGVELDSIPGTGAEGRLTKEDLLNYVQKRYPAANPTTAAPVSPQPVPQTYQPEPVVAPVFVAPVATPPAYTEPEPITVPQHTSPAALTDSGDEIIEMDRMRRLISGHMTTSIQTSAHVTSFVEADVTNLVLWREKVKKDFEKREGMKITFTPIFVEAVIHAIKDFPMINVSVNGNQIIKKKDINIGMATALPNGNLIVPVIHKADQLSIVGLTEAVNGLADKARKNKLSPDEVQGGTFTITNIGTFGNIMGTPIINQPQVAILALGVIKKKAAVIETSTVDMIAIRQMMYLSMSYDHRVVDGFLGGSFLRRVADYLEHWDINREI